MEKIYPLRIEHVSNGFIIRFRDRVFIARDRNEVAEFVGRLIVVELMSDDQDIWHFDIVKK